MGFVGMAVESECGFLLLPLATKMGFFVKPSSFPMVLNGVFLCRCISALLVGFSSKFCPQNTFNIKRVPFSSSIREGIGNNNLGI